MIPGNYFRGTIRAAVLVRADKGLRAGKKGFEIYWSCPNDFGPGHFDVNEINCLSLFAPEVFTLSLVSILMH